MNIFKKLGNWLTGVVDSLNNFFNKAQNAIEKVFNALSKEAQQVTIEASRIIDIINKNVDETPEVVVQLIEASFPGISKEKIKKLLATAADEVNNTNTLANLPLETLINKLQDYLKTRPSDEAWAKASSGLAKILALLLAKERGVALVWAIVEMVMTWVYENKVKNKN